MFEDSLVESAALLRTHNRWPAMLSLTAQCAVAVLIGSLPLLHPELLPTHSILPATLTPPRPPAPPPPPVHLAARPATAANAAPAAPNSAPATPLFRDLIHSAGPAVDAPALPVIDLGNSNSSAPLGINSSVPAAPHVTVAPAARPTAAVPVSSGVLAGYLIAPIRPIYPEIARITHVEGAVVIDAIISPAGAIESAHVRSGPPMLAGAALDAVRQARYRPFLLNGQPTQVQTTITIYFKMGG